MSSSFKMVMVMPISPLLLMLWFFLFLILLDVSGGSFWDSGILVLLIGLGLKWC